MWVGELERSERLPDLAVDPAYVAARLLVTAHGTPLGLVEVALDGGRASAAAVGAVVHTRFGSAADPPPAPASVEPLTVVVATRGRAEHLEQCVRALLAGDHPAIDVLVVDNDPDDEATADAVARIADSRVRYVHEARRGASVARNRGLQEATTAVVAFTDDDTEPDRRWAARIAGAFAADPTLVCLSGPVLAARLDTDQEQAADAALGWNQAFASRRFSLADPPADSPVFPFSPGLFGIGANMAVRADVARAVGGYDEALGPGTSTLAGEDCEFMVRLVLAGHVLGYEPGVYVWHHHRPTPEALRRQVRGYATGLGSFLTKVALDPTGRAAALRLAPAAITRLRQITEREAHAGAGRPGCQGRERLRGLVHGSWAYLRTRRTVRRAGGRVPPLVDSRTARPRRTELHPHATPVLDEAG